MVIQFLIVLLIISTANCRPHGHYPRHIQSVQTTIDHDLHIPFTEPEINCAKVENEIHNFHHEKQEEYNITVTVNFQHKYNFTICLFENNTGEQLENLIKVELAKLPITNHININNTELVLYSELSAVAQFNLPIFVDRSLYNQGIHSGTSVYSGFHAEHWKNFTTTDYKKTNSNYTRLHYSRRKRSPTLSAIPNIVLLNVGGFSEEKQGFLSGVTSNGFVQQNQIIHAGILIFTETHIWQGMQIPQFDGFAVGSKCHRLPSEANIARGGVIIYYSFGTYKITEHDCESRYKQKKIEYAGIVISPLLDPKVEILVIGLYLSPSQVCQTTVLGAPLIAYIDKILQKHPKVGMKIILAGDWNHYNVKCRADLQPVIDKYGLIILVQGRTHRHRGSDAMLEKESRESGNPESPEKVSLDQIFINQQFYNANPSMVITKSLWRTDTVLDHSLISFHDRSTKTDWLQESEKKYNMFCPKCGRLRPTEESLQIHVQACTSKYNNKAEKKDPIPCPYPNCHAERATVQYLEKHIQLAHDESGDYGCIYESCPCTGKDAKSLRGHLMNDHKRDIIKCTFPDCTRTFSGTLKTDHYYQHALIHSPEIVGAEYTCPLCTQGLSSQSKLKDHKKILHDTSKAGGFFCHAIVKPVDLDIIFLCPARSDTVTGLQNHQRATGHRRPLKPYGVPMANYDHNVRIQHPNELKWYKSTNYGINLLNPEYTYKDNEFWGKLSGKPNSPILCGFCNSPFRDTTLRSRQEHVATVHLGARDLYHCPHCKFTSWRPENCQDHKRSHSNGNSDKLRTNPQYWVDPSIERISKCERKFVDQSQQQYDEFIADEAEIIKKNGEFFASTEEGRQYSTRTALYSSAQEKAKEADPSAFVSHPSCTVRQPPSAAAGKYNTPPGSPQKQSQSSSGQYLSQAAQSPNRPLSSKIHKPNTPTKNQNSNKSPSLARGGPSPSTSSHNQNPLLLNVNPQNTNTRQRPASPNTSTQSGSSSSSSTRSHNQNTNTRKRPASPNRSTQSGSSSSSSTRTQNQNTNIPKSTHRRRN